MAKKIIKPNSKLLLSSHSWHLCQLVLLQDLSVGRIIPKRQGYLISGGSKGWRVQIRRRLFPKAPSYPYKASAVSK